MDSRALLDCIADYVEFRGRVRDGEYGPKSPEEIASGEATLNEISSRFAGLIQAK